MSAVSEGPSNIKIRLGQETGYATEINNFNGLGNFCVDDQSDSFNIGKLSIMTYDNFIPTEQCGTRKIIQFLSTLTGTTISQILANSKKAMMQKQ